MYKKEITSFATYVSINEDLKIQDSQNFKYLTLRLYIGSFWTQAKFSGQIPLEIGKSVA